MTDIANNKERNMSLDILRIIAAFAVVVLHISSDYIVTNDVGGGNFSVALFLNSLTRFAVPVFVMISGSIFLDGKKEISVKKIWLHNILRMAVLYFVWSFAYYVFTSLYYWKLPIFNGGIIQTVNGVVYATTHLWFLGMIIGLYAVTPIIREWIKNAEEKNIRYFLTIYFIFQIVMTTLKVLIGKSLADSLIDFFNIAEISGYVGYYVLGWYLNNYGLQKKMKTVLYVVFPIGIALNFVIALIFSKRTGAFNPGIYDSFGVFTYLNTITLFMIVNNIGRKIKSKRIIIEISKDTLGVYLMHMMIWSFIKSRGAMDYIPYSFIGSLLYAIGISVICILLSEALRRIPFVGRYLC